MQELGLTPSQMKILLDQEQWMKDVGAKYTDERTRIDAADDIKRRFPTESVAKDILEIYGGDPVVRDLYSKKSINFAKEMQKRTPKKSKSKSRK